MEIIPVVENSWSELRDIRLASLKDSPDSFAVSYEVALTYSEAEWRNRASGTDGRKFFIAKIDSLSVGIVGGVCRGGEYELISVWVSPDQRGNGVAKLLINEIILHAKSINKECIFLEVLSNNISACKTYERCGFSFVSSSAGALNGSIKVLNKMELDLKAI